jgi:sortase (surface protein transpeptidase)
MIKIPTTARDGATADVPDLARTGRRRFLQGVGALAGAGAVASVVPIGTSEAAGAVPTGASRYVSLAAAVRAVDTRSPGKYTFTRLSADRITVPLAGHHGIPQQATAVMLTVAGINRSQPNWVVVAPSGGAIPVAANLILPDANEISANLVTVKVGAGGAVDVKSRVPCDVVVDVLGYYEPVTGAVRAGRFVALSPSKRALDTRPGATQSGGFTTVDVTSLVPADASSVVINLTATETTRSGFFTAVPMAQTTKPTTSSLNVVGAGATRGAAVNVPVTTSGGRLRFKVYSLYAAKLIVDVIGYYTSESSPASSVGLFVPVAPQRVLDTRDPGQIGRLWPRWVVECRLPGAAADASAVVLNVTGVDSRSEGHLRVSAARLPIPDTANVNWSKAGAAVANQVISPITATYGFQVYSSHGAHVVADLFGYFTGRPKFTNRPMYVNPPPPPAPPAWVLRVPKIGLTSTVLAGPSQWITDSGRSWHWTGTGDMGQVAHVAVFAHRTSAGGPFRNLNLLQVGDAFTVTTGDNREYTYRMVRRDLSDAVTANILSAVRAHPGTTFSMVACTVGYDRTRAAYPDVWAPTSLRYRIVVTGELVSWREL